MPKDAVACFKLYADFSGRILPLRTLNLNVFVTGSAANPSVASYLKVHKIDFLTAFGTVRDVMYSRHFKWQQEWKICINEQRKHRQDVEF